MNQCKRCDSTSLTYVTNYEHVCCETDNIIYDNGWLCDSCETFYHESGKYYEFYRRYQDPIKTNYSQLMIN